MSLRVTTDSINTNRPGAYFDSKVKSTPVGVGTSGNIIIVGEASGGAAASSIDSVDGDVLKENFFTPDQLDKVTAKYLSGPIVDAFRALSSPSSGADITGSANRIYIAKTNKGVAASATVATAYGTLSDKNFGASGNKYSFQVSQSISEVAASQTGSSITANLGVGLDNATFDVRADGAAAVTVTLSAIAADHDTIAEVASEIDGQLIGAAAALECVVGTGDTIIIRHAVDAAANSKGTGKSFELIETNVGDLALLGLTEGLEVSSTEPEVQLDINRVDTNVNEQFLIAADVALNIGYEGTTATLTKTDTTITTTTAGGSGSDLSIEIADYKTLTELADFINSQTGYTCSVAGSFGQQSPIVLDNVTAVGICSSGATLEAGRIKKGADTFNTKANQSIVLKFAETAKVGLPDVQAKTFLSGGSLGSTLAADVVSVTAELESVDANFIVPLFSRDASDDITDGLTDSSSTYTIDAIHAGIKSHVLKMSTIKIKKHRSAILAFDGSFTDAKAKASSLANARVSLCIQKTDQVDSSGVVKTFGAWHTAAIAAGMQAAGFYKAIVNKFANVISFTDPSGFDSGKPGDIEEALDAGLLFLEKAIVGNKWVSDQTTYGIDTNFVYNSIQAMYAADLVALDLTDSIQTAFVGKSLADVNPSTAISFISSKMDNFKKQKLITASDDAPLGFRNAKVSINGPVMEISVEIKLATALYFVPISLEISQVSSSASI